MDPLSIVSAAASLVQTIELASQAIRRVKDADCERMEAERRVSELQSTLLPLKDYLRAPSTNDGAQLRALVVECHEQSRDLIQILEKINAEDARPGTTQKLRRALRAKTYRKEIERRSTELSNLQQRLQLLLLHDFTTSSRVTQTVFERVPVDSHDFTATVEDRLAAIRARLSENVELDEKTAAAGTAMPDNAVRAKLIAGLESAKTAIAEATRTEQILKSLSFVDMTSRANQIKPASMNTCSWIFDESRTPFANWLRHGSGIFYISGKPGSGKSTLMHSLTTDPRTHAALADSSSREAPLIASFYFWLPGTTLQKSREGLFMSLLYQICRAMPNLVPLVFPNRWKELGHASQELASQNPWTLRELKEAVIRLCEAPHFANRRFCIFVDALDECEDGVEELLHDIIDMSRFENVKFCVSGRPYVFNLAFRDQTEASSVVMEDHNRQDIHRYIHETLPKSLSNSGSQEATLTVLADQIERQSEGVFLWVYLTVESVREGIRERDDMQTLQKRIVEMPSTLGSLYDRMLGSIDTVQESRMAKILLLMLANRGELPLPAMAASYILLPSAKRSTYGLDALMLSAEERREQINTLEEYILGHSAGLLSVNPGRITWALKGEDSAISFPHRSVLDFFEQPDVLQRLESAVAEEFDPNVALCDSHLDWIEALDDVSALDRTSGTELFANLAKQVIEYMRRVTRSSADSITQMHRISERLDVVCTNIWQRSGSGAQHWSTILLHSNDQQPKFLYSDFTMLMASAGITSVVEDHFQGLSGAQFEERSPYLLAATLRLTHDTLTSLDEDVQPLLSLLMDAGADIMAELEVEEFNTVSAVPYQDSVYNIFYLCAGRGMNSWRYRETQNYIFSRLRQRRADESPSIQGPQSLDNQSGSLSAETLISEQAGGLPDGATKFLIDSIAEDLSEALLIDDAIREEQHKAASELIKYSALVLSQMSNGSRIGQAVAFLQGHHKDIARRTFELAVLNDGPPTLKKKIDSWQIDHRKAHGHKRTAESDMQQLSVEVGDTFKLNGLLKECPGLPGIYASIKSSDAYKWLAVRLLDITSNDWLNCELFFLIRDAILTMIDRDESTPHSYLISSMELEWNIATFIQSQYQNQPDFSNYSRMPVLCGTFPDVEFLGLSEYLQSLWPQVSSQVLEFLSAYVQAYRSKTSEAQVTSDGTTLIAYLTPEATFLRLAGPLLTISQIAEALVWLGAVCQTSPAADRIAHCRPRIGFHDQHWCIRYHAEVISESVVDKIPGKKKVEVDDDDDYDKDGGAEEEDNGDIQRASCWRKMLRNPTIAQGYPIPLRRHNERGLGIGLNALSAISCAPLLTRFDGKLLMKGAVSMLVPVVQTAASIVWHFILAPEKDGEAREWLPYSAIDSCESITIAEDDEVLKCRHFVGWTTQAQHWAGTSRIDYRSVDVSNCDPPGPGLVLSSLSISGGQYVTGGATVAPGEAHHPLALDPTGFYETRITTAAKWIVVFYNPAERRAWLLDGATSLLYLTRLWAAQNTESCKGKDVGRGIVPVFQAGVLSAAETLRKHKNRSIQLFPKNHNPLESEDEIIAATGTPALGGSDDWWLLGDQIQRIHETMGRVRSEMMTRYAKNKRKISTTSRILEGFEAIHMLGIGSFNPKAAKLESGAKDWLAVVKDPNVSAICIFGTNIGDLIGNPNDPCSARGHVPVNEDYLTAPIAVIRSFSTAWNSDWLKLTADLYLPYPVPGLEDHQCTPSTAGRCSFPMVSKLQDVHFWHSQRARHKGDTIYNLPAGAIVIGGSPRDRLAPFKTGGQKFRGTSTRGSSSLHSNASTTSLDNRSQTSASASTQADSIWSTDDLARQASTAGSRTDISQISPAPGQAPDVSKAPEVKDSTDAGSWPSTVGVVQPDVRPYLADLNASLSAYIENAPISINLLIAVIIAACLGIFIGLAI